MGETLGQEIEGVVASVAAATSVSSTGQVSETVSEGGTPVTLATPVTLNTKEQAALGVTKAIAGAVAGGHIDPLGAFTALESLLALFKL